MTENTSGEIYYTSIVTSTKSYSKLNIYQKCKSSSEHNFLRKKEIYTK